MASEQVNTMNLSDDGEGMVPINQNPSTSFTPEKNVSQSKETTMDSTPINDIMMEPPMMTDEPKMQGMMPQMTAPQPQGAYPSPQAPQQPENKNPLNLTDEQLTALGVLLVSELPVPSRRLSSTSPRITSSSPDWLAFPNPCCYR